MALSPNINVMQRAARKAGRSLLHDFGEVEQLQVSRKGPSDFVSTADMKAEKIEFSIGRKVFHRGDWVKTCKFLPNLRAGLAIYELIKK